MFRPRRALKDLSQESNVAEALRNFGRERSWTNEKHLELCRVAAPTFFEEKRAQWMIGQLEALGYEARIDRAGNVVATRPEESRGPWVAVTAHLDTVLSPRNADDIRVAPDGRFLGPGVADNGAGLAGLLSVARQYALRPPDKSQAGLMLVANVGEEGEGNLSGMRYLCRQSNLAERIQAFLVLDGPGVEHLTTQALGSRRFEVVFSGPGGHSWSDAGNPNAVHAMSRTIADFLDCHGRRAGFLQTRYGRSTANFSLIDGGTSINSIPASARAKLDLRSESGEVLDELAELLTDCVERALVLENERVVAMRGSGRLTAKIREIGSRPGGHLLATSRLLETMRQVDEHLGISSRLDCASTDANIPLSMGLEAVSIGAGGSGGGAHSEGEWYHPEGRELGLRRIYLALCQLLRAA
ncbi:M20/M25/M40 family metallo-hydrolase [Bryobacter aggregatus]|uniref:M20/M25/M40 family metallo-hydrolase n=1 Tax=Bryobacter aggregatus TaxID=360054 RepID=UPI00056C36C8|nr:M20/M25/M40 family metallo-hydrolase [Bryobacter aggregatus]